MSDESDIAAAATEPVPERLFTRAEVSEIVRQRLREFREQEQPQSLPADALPTLDVSQFKGALVNELRTWVTSSAAQQVQQADDAEDTENALDYFRAMNSHEQAAYRDRYVKEHGGVRAWRKHIERLHHLYTQSIIKQLSRK